MEVGILSSLLEDSLPRVQHPPVLGSPRLDPFGAYIGNTTALVLSSISSWDSQDRVDLANWRFGSDQLQTLGANRRFGSDQPQTPGAPCGDPGYVSGSGSDQLQALRATCADPGYVSRSGSFSGRFL